MKLSLSDIQNGLGLTKVILLLCKLYVNCIYELNLLSIVLKLHNKSIT
jgi:hypothetical protein